jgi:predicted Zn-dependent peptidase
LRSGRRARRLPTLGAVILVAAFAAPVLSAQEPSLGERLPVRRVVLENGMRLVVLPHGGAPTVAFVVRYAVGGVHEHLGTTGAAHLLEHMLFKGTTSIGTTDPEAEWSLFEGMDEAHDTLLAARARGDSTEVERLRDRIDALEDEARQYVVPNEFDRILTRAGAQGLNATTTSEATIYFVELPSNRAELWFVLEADRMANPVFREFYSERDVVTEERRMRVDTNPGGFLYEQHLAAAFTMHPYGVPVVGYMSDLETLSRRDVATYFRRFYGPNNAVVTIVGDVDPDRIVAWAERYMSPIARGEEPPLVLAVEPPQRGERRVEVVWDAEPALRIGWHVPSSLSEEAPALAMASALLTGGRTSRLYRRLILEDRLATAVVSSLGPGDRFPQLFQIDATPRAPNRPAEVEAAIYEEIERLAAEGPDETELQRVRNQIEAGNVRRLQSNMGLAIQLAESEALHGDWRETFRTSARLRRVTAEDVRDVLARYLISANRTVATLHRRKEGG